MEATNGPALASIAKSPSSLDELRAIDQAARQFSGDVLAQMR
jgi:hypothetical protein